MHLTLTRRREHRLLRHGSFQRDFALNQDGDLSGVGSSRSSHIVNTSTIGAVLFPIGVLPMRVFSDGSFSEWSFSEWSFSD